MKPISALRLMAALVCFHLLVGCAFGPTRVVQVEPADKDRLARVHLIRNGFEPSDTTFKIEVRYEHVGDLRDQDYIAFYVPLEETEVYVTVPGVRVFSFPLHVTQAGTQHYLVMSGSAKVTGVRRLDAETMNVFTRLQRDVVAVDREEAGRIVSTFGKQLPP